ncbi:hypothetical protein P7K49_011040 [Saguinus oedipus]|uniref:Lactoperoxidase n=1 Tax=Saguinus oedipus TaxID=9490 RepID=A0ABQ9VQW9_SAGOE|nr:hypothetical protein P7K49_011040 [Saguinus oedipus]
MSSETPTSRQLSEYLKHAKGRTRTAIRNGQVWEESLKRLRQKAPLTNVTGPSLDLTSLSREVGCGAPAPVVRCDPCSPYRTITGDCNNRWPGLGCGADPSSRPPRQGLCPLGPPGRSATALPAWAGVPTFPTFSRPCVSSPLPQAHCVSLEAASFPEAGEPRALRGWAPFRDPTFERPPFLRPLPLEQSLLPPWGPGLWSPRAGLPMLSADRACFRRKPALGAANRALARWLPAEYEDGLSLPFGWTPGKTRNGFPLPLVRAGRARVKDGSQRGRDILPSYAGKGAGEINVGRWGVRWRAELALSTARGQQSSGLGDRHVVVTCRPPEARYPGVSRADGLPALSCSRLPQPPPLERISCCLPGGPICWPHRSWQPYPEPLSYSRTPGASAREVSNKIVGYLNEEGVLDQNRSLLFMQWGQIVDHDLDFAPDTELGSSEYSKAQCDEYCIQGDNCFPIMFQPNDPKVETQGKCMPFFRAGFVCPTPPYKSLAREQINALTSFLDASFVYSSEPSLASRLRNLSSPLGLMAVNQEVSDHGLSYLPYDSKKPSPCEFINTTAHVPCFLAGDSRASEHILLATSHTLFLREHNRLATELKRLNPQWDGEKLYQEARKILGAFVQIITFRDYLPIVLGDHMQKWIPPYQGYNESVDPTISNVFTFAFRFGHLEIPSTVFRLDENYQPWGPEPELPLHTLFFNTWRIVKDGGIDPLVRGLLAKKSKLMKQNKMMTGELRNKLFQPTHRIHGFDLAAINTQRCRDHGQPGYNSWRAFCDLSQPQTLEELNTVLKNKMLTKKLLCLYGTPNNIDIWIGAIAEPLVERGRVGPLLACLLGKQFQQIRDGDRQVHPQPGREAFWWENPGVFTQKQKDSLWKISFSRLVCDNTRITKVPRDPFRANSYPNDFVDCSAIDKLDLSPWASVKN